MSSEQPSVVPGSAASGSASATAASTSSAAASRASAAGSGAAAAALAARDASGALEDVPQAATRRPATGAATMRQSSVRIVRSAARRRDDVERHPLPVALDLDHHLAPRLELSQREHVVVDVADLVRAHL